VGEKLLRLLKPLYIQGKKSKVEIEIETWKNHTKLGVSTYPSYWASQLFGDEEDNGLLPQPKDQ